MRYRGLFGRRARRRCPHEDLHGIYGDAINHVGGWRLHCLDCGRYLDGPVSLAHPLPSPCPDHPRSKAECPPPWPSPDTAADRSET